MKNGSEEEERHLNPDIRALQPRHGCVLLHIRVASLNVEPRRVVEGEGSEEGRMVDTD